jgi:hypothetical protein
MSVVYAFYTIVKELHATKLVYVIIKISVSTFHSASIIRTSQLTPFHSASIIRTSQLTPFHSASIIRTSQLTPFHSVSIIRTSQLTPFHSVSIIRTSQLTPFKTLFTKYLRFIFTNKYRPLWRKRCKILS